MEIKPREPMIGDWLKEGDLGFIFAVRGVGKTWFGMDLARALADGKNFGPWPEDLAGAGVIIEQFRRKLLPAGGSQANRERAA
jgi:hypothetical protein